MVVRQTLSFALWRGISFISLHIRLELFNLFTQITYFLDPVFHHFPLKFFGCIFLFSLENTSKSFAHEIEFNIGESKDKRALQVKVHVFSSSSIERPFT